MLEAGSSAAFVVRTGAGKTTLVNLIPRLFDPDEGEVIIDGVNLKEWDLQTLREIIGYVPQETFLFSTTIRENISFGREEATQEDVEEAAEIAQVRDNILEFEKAFETLVGERGDRSEEHTSELQ